MSRKAGNWLSAYQEYTKESESPDSYHLFCGLSAISSVVRRNAYVDQGIYLLYPNLYLVFVLLSSIDLILTCEILSAAPQTTARAIYAM